MTRRASDHRPLWESQAAIARRLGLARSTVSRACRPGGPLHPACQRDRIDVAHPAAVEWIRLHEVRPLDPARYLTLAEFAELVGERVDELDLEALRPAIVEPIDVDHPAAQAFLRLAGGRTRLAE